MIWKFFHFFFNPFTNGHKRLIIDPFCQIQQNNSFFEMWLYFLYQAYSYLAWNSYNNYIYAWENIFIMRRKNDLFRKFDPFKKIWMATKLFQEIDTKFIFIRCVESNDIFFISDMFENRKSKSSNSKSQYVHVK
jgi:hypothetical protein